MSLFIQNLLLLNAGIAVVIGSFALLRHLLKSKVHTKILCALWIVIFLRMLIPMPIETSIGLIKDSFVSQTYTAVEKNIKLSPAAQNTNENANTPDTKTTESTSQILPDESKPQPARMHADEVIKKYNIPLLVYAFGAAAILAYIIISNILFGRKINASISEIELNNHDRQIFSQQKMKARNVYLSEYINSPCLTGLLNPKIVLSPKSYADEKTRRYSLYHETTHYKHKDNFIYMLGLAACIINWFNPLMWIALILSKKDREVLCDEKVVRLIGEDEVIDYGKSLLYLSQKAAGSALAASATMTGGKNEMKQRIKNLAGGRKKWILVSALLAAIIIALVIFIGIKKTAEEENSVHSYGIKLYNVRTIFDLENYPEYTAYFEKARDPEKTILLSLIEADLDKDGTDELYSNSIIKGEQYNSSIIECYDMKTGTYSTIENDDNWTYDMAIYGDSLYIVAVDEQTTASDDLIRVYKASLMDGKLSYTELNSNFEQKIVEYFSHSGALGISSGDNHISVLSYDSIKNISIYDISSGDEPICSYTQDDEDILGRFFFLFAYGSNRDEQAIDHPYKAVMTFIDEGVERTITCFFGDSEYLSVNIGSEDYIRKNDAFLHYLLYLVEENSPN